MVSLDEDALIERTLFHLSMCVDTHDAATALEEAARQGPSCSSWADLLAAIMEGLERGWVHSAHLERDDANTQTSLTWNATDRGERAMRAFRKRLADAPVVDETEEGGS